MSAHKAKAELLKRRTLVAQQARGREHASSTTLSASYGLPIEEVQTILRGMGVRDDG